ncbi:MAG: hypothetical protein ABFR02_03385 [Campylobacterota bacterium]
MAKKDREEIQTKLQAVSPRLLESFSGSDEQFLPSEAFRNGLSPLAQCASTKLCQNANNPLYYKLIWYIKT